MSNESRLNAGRGSDARSWREQLAPFARPDSRRAALSFATSVLPYLGLTVAIYVLLGRSLLALLLGVPAAVFLVRSFIVFHDCSHGSFLPSRRANLSRARAPGPLAPIQRSAFVDAARSAPRFNRRRKESSPAPGPIEPCAHGRASMGGRGAPWYQPMPHPRLWRPSFAIGPIPALLGADGRTAFAEKILAQRPRTTR